MTTPVRYYSSTALVTNLTGSISPSDVTINVASTDGFPGATPYTLAIDYGAANEELVDVTNVAGLSLTVTRAVDLTSASSHNTGAVVRHVSSARDFREAKAHELADTNVHGFTPADGEFVGTTKTQTLTNKTLVKATGTFENIDIYNTGTWRTSVIGDSTNPTVSRLAILDNEVSLTPMAVFTGTGALNLYYASGESLTNYRLRVTNVAATGDRFYVLTSGQTVVKPEATLTNPALTVRTPDVLGTKMALAVADDATSTGKFIVYNDGHVDINGSGGTFSLFDIKHLSATPTGGYMRILNSSDVSLWGINADGKMVATRTADIRTDGDGSVAALRVYANTGGQSGNLTEWRDSGGTLRARVSATGEVIGRTLDAADPRVDTGASLAGHAGWSGTYSRYRESAGVAFLMIEVERVGGAFTPANSTGQIFPDMPLATINSAYAPPRSLYVACSTGVGHGTVRFQPDGEIQLLTWIPSPAQIGQGATVRATVSWVRE